MATSIGRSSKDLQIAVGDWLLQSNVRVRSGKHTGAIAGWLDERGEPAFLYPEVAGYYLSWLALVAKAVAVDVGSAASSTVDWLNRISVNGPPPTRCYFDATDDWRNRATFTFDLAMICRGLRAVRMYVPEQPRRDLLGRLLRHALPAVDVLPAAIRVTGMLPNRWSTRPGSFQLKTAAALLSVLEHPALWNTFHRWSGRVLADTDPADSHGAFYALEGLMQFGRICEAATCFETLFAGIDHSRSDVVAQTLRMGHSLRSFGYLQTRAWLDRLAELRYVLECFIADSGAVSFRPISLKPLHWNTWSAIFAWQALA